MHWPRIRRHRERETLPLRYTYRLSPTGMARYVILTAGSDLEIRLHTASVAPGRVWKCDRLVLAAGVPAVRPGDVLDADLPRRALLHNGAPLEPTVVSPGEARRFVGRVELTVAGRRRSRDCPHYLPTSGKPIGHDYFLGDDYADYPAVAGPLTGAAVELVRRHHAHGRLLDVGCAYGLYVAAFLEAGYDAYGLDVSSFAIAEAESRIGPGRAFLCDVDTDPVPIEGSFDVFFLNDVLEHSRAPSELLRRLTARAAPGAHLFVHTSNADSLTHRVLGADWEAYSDYSHHGVELVSASSLRSWLQELGWELVDWRCEQVWVDGVDPTLRRLGTVFGTDPELATFLAERDLGDFLQVVACKR